MGPSVDVCDCWLLMPWTACYESDPTASKIQSGVALRRLVRFQEAVLSSKRTR